MTAKPLPPDYVSLGPVSLHRHDVERYTEDIDRFLAHLDDARALMYCEPDDTRRHDIWSSSADWAALLLTVAELGDFMEKLARTGEIMQSRPLQVH